MYSNGVLAQALGAMYGCAHRCYDCQTTTQETHMKILASLAVVAILAATASIVQARGENKCEGYGTCYPMTEYEF